MAGDTRREADMSAPSFVASVQLRFSLVRRESDVRLESRSGAGVHAVRTPDGPDAYLKVTPAALGGHALEAARRELRFYTTVAPTAPVRTPTLLDHLDTDDGVALLLEAAGEPAPVGRWAPEMWSALGCDLAALHAMAPPAQPGWHGPDPLRQALADPDLAATRTFWAPTLPHLDELLSRLAELEADMTAVPPAFVHGDCHTDNIVHRAGALVFCDWQSAGTGRPLSDLAFLSVRATPAGVTVPAAVLDAYLAGGGHERRTVERALLAEELAIFLLQWPPFAAYNSPAAVERVRRRTRMLADRWLNMPAPSTDAPRLR
ncbi:MAG TPA: aminoglycoside phosphotransferase family protein [Micromonosporaceae bacterium]|jgi:fructosamine-3-kinase